MTNPITSQTPAASALGGRVEIIGPGAETVARKLEERAAGEAEHTPRTDGLRNKCLSLSEHEAADEYHSLCAKLESENIAFVAALESIELRLTQARLASNIGRESSVRKADFLRRQCEAIAQDARAALAPAKEVS